MRTCANCGATDVDGKRFCSECGAPTSMSSHPTVESPKESPLRPVSSSQRFHPGQMFGGRYRIVAQLGRGGMGEVYRADDLKLGQAVAIKLLPRGLEQDPNLLERLRNEVRLSLRVTHPNVCRVFDIGEVDGRQFLSMEYVDGEDLASLLRRIGRLPHGKAVDVARQLCAGLAAAHEEGILHRDLKPANIMIDGRGRAKITDFGLAGAIRGINGAEAMAGTPGYLAPEQLAGKELTVGTDIYALGIVLFELFTGERVFPGDSPADVLKQQRSGTHTAPSTGTKEMEPSVERVVMRCLETDPGARPPSAATVAAALPGGDPIAAALAAGETPSPEMVAEAGGEGSLRPAVAVPIFLLILLGLVSLPFAKGDRLLGSIPLSKPPSELRVIARSIAAEVGYPDEPVDRAYGFSRNLDYFEYVKETSDSPDRWKNLGTARPVPLHFWYRESPAYFRPWRMTRGVSYKDPPQRLSGMLSMRLGPEGHLQRFRAVPPQLDEEAGPWKEPDWDALFSRAGLDPETFEPASPIWAPLAATDTRRAWATSQTQSPEAELRVEAASFRGKPVFFSVVAPWDQPELMVDPDEETFPIFFVIAETVLVLLIIGAVLLARRNRRLGRTDGKGAARLAVIFFVLELSRFVFQGHHRPVPTEIAQLFEACAWGFFFAALAWTFYSAIEPYVRRLWPDLLIGWTRLLDGRFRDPLVGRHILFGALAGLITVHWTNLLPTVTRWLGMGATIPWGSSDQMGMSASWSQAAALVVEESFPPFFFPLWSMLLLVLLRVVFRSKWLASIVFVVGLSLLLQGGPEGREIPFMLGFGMALLFWTWAWFVLTRFGLLVMMMLILFANWGRFALTADITSWHFPPVAVVLVLLAAVAVHGFRTALGGRTLFRDVLTE